MNSNFDKNLELISNILQIMSYEILVKDFNNTDLMKYLKHQDNLLNRIIEQNNEILNLLKKEVKSGNKKEYQKNC